MPPSRALAIVILEYADAPKVVCLPHDYGFLIRWWEQEEPELYLYDKSCHRIVQTSDFSAFLAGLNAFPSGSRLDEITLCCGETSRAGMPREDSQRLAGVLRDKGFRLTGENDGNFNICTCESREVRLLKVAK